MNFSIDNLSNAWHYCVANVWGLLAAFAVGAGFVASTFGFFRHRLERRIRRYITFINGTDIQQFDVGFFTRIRITRNARYLTQSPAVLAAQAPAARAQHLLPETTYQETDSLLTYYMPEVDSLELPLGIQAYRDIRLLFGNPPKHVAALKLRPVIVQNEGVWYPAFVDEKSGLTIPQHVLSKHKRRAPRKHGYRNLYACDFVEAGDILGAIVPEGTKAFPIVVRAPVSGFILAFEVEQYTQVVPNANIMFLGESVDLKPVYYLEEGGIVGIFRFPADQTSPVGKIVQKNSILCEVDSITHPREVPMPETGLVLRQYKKVGDAVQYMARDSDTKELKHEVLFLYLPLQPLNS